MADPSPRGTTRRTFLGGVAAAATAIPATASAARREPPRPRPPAPKRILILGGTGFLGPAIVEAARARGHVLTLFNRGRSDPKLFPDVETLIGQRRRPAKPEHPKQDLSALEGREWDVVVDTSGYYTGEVEDAAELLKDAVGQYVFVSSISVYRDLEKNAGTVREDSPLATIEDPYTLDMGEGYANYGALKAACEQVAERAFPGRSTAIRPGYIVGPRDRSDRFTYWPVRLKRGGEVLSPGAQ